MKKLLSIITVVVTYNRLNLLLCCLDHIRSQSCRSDILVVDNASTDGTMKIMREWEADKRIIYKNMGSNLGGAGGFNYGMRYAAENGYDLVWLMDDDCQPESDALEKLICAAQRIGGADKFGFLSSCVLWTDGTACTMNRQKKMSRKYRNVWLEKLGIIRIKQATFVSILVPVEKLIKYGLPLAPYFIWNDDIEFTRRLSIRGREPCYMVNDSVVVHATANNYGNNVALDSVKRMDRYTMAYRNEYCTYRKEGLGGILFYIARCSRDLLRICFMAKDHRSKRFHSLISGIWQGLRFNPEIEYPNGICR